MLLAFMPRAIAQNWLMTHHAVSMQTSHSGGKNKWMELRDLMVAKLRHAGTRRTVFIAVVSAVAHGTQFHFRASHTCEYARKMPITGTVAKA